LHIEFSSSIDYKRIKSATLATCGLLNHDYRSDINGDQMNLGSAFARRKQIDEEINTWINRMNHASRNSKSYKTLKIDKTPYIPIPGSIKEYKRSYKIEEIRENLDRLIKEDQELAFRISKTNLIAKGRIIDLEGLEKELTIPELLVLKNDLTPKMERILRAIPIRAEGVEILKSTDNHQEYIIVNEVRKKESTMGEKGQVAENMVLDYYSVDEVEDFGVSQREIYDEVDKIHNFIKQIKSAINTANETELVDI